MSRPVSSKIAFVARIILGLIFIYAAWMKLKDPWQLFAVSVDGYELLPPQGVVIVARTLPWFELILGALLVGGLWLRITAPAVTALLLGFFGILLSSYMKGMAIDCGCFGPGGALGPTTLIREGALLLVSIALTVLTFTKRQLNSVGQIHPLPSPIDPASLTKPANPHQANPPHKSSQPHHPS
jgi:uncharacterized membrane protein YphA (DoxX/SURF4 family)